ncbi:MAG: UPF0149 family protein [Thermoleophilia bacterium]
MTQIDIGDFTDEQAMRLQEFLAGPERPEGTMSYFHLAGFMFALACAPEPVMPSEWMPLVFNDGEAVYEDMVEARAILGALMSLSNRINEEVREGKAQLPPGCLILERASANLEAAALSIPVSFVRFLTVLVVRFSPVLSSLLPPCRFPPS